MAINFVSIQEPIQPASLSFNTAAGILWLLSNCTKLLKPHNTKQRIIPTSVVNMHIYYHEANNFYQPNRYRALLCFMLTDRPVAAKNSNYYNKNIKSSHVRNVIWKSGCMHACRITAILLHTAGY